MAKVRTSSERLGYKKDFTNMAQAFTMAEKMLLLGGRKRTMSAVLTNKNGELSFLFGNGEAMDDGTASNALLIEPSSHKVHKAGDAAVNSICTDLGPGKINLGYKGTCDEGCEVKLKGRLQPRSMRSGWQCPRESSRQSRTPGLIPTANLGWHRS